MNFLKKLKDNNSSIIFVSSIFSLITLILSIIAMVLYSSNCPSEFNGNKVSMNVIGLDIGAVIASAIAALVQIAGLFLIKDKKNAYVFFWSRLFDYSAFVCLLGGFLFQILDEYSLLGTILYPIVSGTVGDHVDPVLSTSYFISLIMLFVSLILSLIGGILLRKKSHSLLKEKEETAKEVLANE